MKNKIFEILRKQVARRATYKLGKVEITDDEIICYVDGKKLKKKEKYLHRYNLIFKMVNPMEEISKIYNLRMPIHYIVKEVHFDREVNIQASTRNCHVTFKNCVFTSGISINFADHITFINNTYDVCDYKTYYSLIPKGHFYISTRNYKYGINKLEFINDEIDISTIQISPMLKVSDFSNPINRPKKPIIKLWLCVKEINITNTDIIGAESIEIKSDKLYIENQYTISKEVEIEAKKVQFNDATINADVISIDAPVIEGKLPVCHEGLFINGIEIDKNEAIIDNYDLELQKQRLELINSLKKIERTCEETISREIKKQPIKRILKK